MLFFKVAPHSGGSDVIDHLGKLLAQVRPLVPKVMGVSHTMVVHVGGGRRNMMCRSTPYIQGSIADAVLHSSVAECMRQL